MSQGVYKRTSEHRAISRKNIKIAQIVAWRSPRTAAAARKLGRKYHEIAATVAASLPRTEKQLEAAKRNAKKAHSVLKCKNGYCQICKKHCHLLRDHDHKTGKKRGKLCSSCNFILGLAHDDPGILEKAARYLRLFGPAPSL